MLSLDEIAPLFTCPRCQASLLRQPDHYLCQSPDCAYSGARSFPVVGQLVGQLVGQWPVLVDFERSILEEQEVLKDAGVSLQPRSQGIKARLKRILFPPNHVQRRNTARLLDLLGSVSKNPLVLVVGGGQIGSGLHPLYLDPSLRLFGFDIYASPTTRFIADAHSIPLQDESVDAVIVQAVLHCMLEPWRGAAEIHRVLKKDGLVYADTPFLQQVCDGAYDFHRFTESGHRYLFRQFELIDSGVVHGPGTQLLWSLDYAARGIFRSLRVGKTLRLLLSPLRYLDRLTPAPYAIDNASSVFFLGRKSDHQITPEEIVQHYKGAQR